MFELFNIIKLIRNRKQLRTISRVPKNKGKVVLSLNILSGSERFGESSSETGSEPSSPRTVKKMPTT
jgi:hypothetical protein